LQLIFFKRITLGRISKKRVKFSIEIVMVRKNLKKSLETKGLQVGATLLDTVGRYNGESGINKHTTVS
jgi:hypothetical protein